MTSSTTAERMSRYNVVLSNGESAWLDALAVEIEAATGAKVSRSEIVRSALAGMRKLSKFGADIERTERVTPGSNRRLVASTRRIKRQLAPMPRAGCSGVVKHSRYARKANRGVRSRPR